MYEKINKIGKNFLFFLHIFSKRSGHNRGHAGERLFLISPIQLPINRETENLCVGGSIPSLAIPLFPSILTLRAGVFPSPGSLPCRKAVLKKSERPLDHGEGISQTRSSLQVFLERLAEFRPLEGQFDGRLYKFQFISCIIAGSFKQVTVNGLVSQ
jgi:hypothetical protein